MAQSERPSRPDGLNDPDICELFDYWRSRAPERKLPGRQHIDPIELGRLLSGMVLYDVERRGAAPRFRVRIWGTAVTKLMGRDCSAGYVDEAGPAAINEGAVAALRDVAETGRPHYWKRTVPDAEGKKLTYSRLALPLASDGECVDMILAYFKPEGAGTTEDGAPAE
jgi:hypothetical protein